MFYLLIGLFSLAKNSNDVFLDPMRVVFLCRLFC